MNDSPAIPAGTILGNYEIKKLLGRGGMGEVYLANDRRLGREVAIKILPAEYAVNPERLSRFEREARSAAMLNHSNICTIHEIGQIDGFSFICMEYIDGITLQSRIASEPMIVEEVLDIGIQIADALEEARKKNLVHRDLKSANILLTPKQQVKILDFGLAKIVAQSVEEASGLSTASNLTESGVVLGTVAYMSPEQALGKSVDHRSDLFSFGVVLYEMLTGQLPFKGKSTTELLDAILHHDPPSVARYNDKVPDPLSRLVNKLLEKDQDERYQTARDVWIDLRRVKKEITGLSGSQTVLAQRTGPLQWMLAAAVVLVVFIGAILWMSQRNQSFSTPESASLVALPCKVYGSPDVQYLTDAVPGTLSTLLAQVEGLETKMPPSSEEVQRVGGNLEKIANAYQVKSLVVSSITAQPNRFVLNVQLVEARSKRMLWSNEYEGTPDSYIELTRQAADGIRSKLQPQSKSSISVSELPRNSEAELLFQQGKYFVNRYNNLHDPADFKLAYSALTGALELEPRLADAAAEIADLYAFKAEVRDDPDEALRQRELWARRALQINPNCARALAHSSFPTVGLSAPGTGDRRTIMQSVLRAIQLAPADPRTQNGLFHELSWHSLVLALAMRKEANRLDPLYLHPYVNIGYMLKLLGKPQEGLPYVERVLQLEPDFDYAVFAKSIILLDLNRKQEAKIFLDRIDEYVKQQRVPEYLLLISKTALSLEERNEQAIRSAMLQVTEMLNDPQASAHDLNELALDLVPWFAKYGKSEEALQILDAVTKRGGVPMYDWLMLCPQLNELREDPRFQNALSTARPQFVETITFLDEARSRNLLPKYLDKPLTELVSKLNIQTKPVAKS